MLSLMLKRRLMFLIIDYQSSSELAHQLTISRARHSSIVVARQPTTLSADRKPASGW